MIRFRQEEGAGGGAGEEQQQQPEQQPEQATQFSVSQEDWEAAQQQIQQLTGIVPTVQQIASYFEQANQQPEDDEDDIDIATYVQRQIQESLAPILPVVNTAAQKSGEETMRKIFSEQKKTIGDFDEELAERAAHSFFQQTGDPRKAVEEGAKYAADYRKRERAAGRDEYKASLQRGPHNQDPAVEGGGDRQIPKAKSYDEVIERYVGTDDL